MYHAISQLLLGSLVFSVVVSAQPANTIEPKSSAKAVPDWRRDAVKFREELTRYEKAAKGDKQFPGTSFDFMGKGGVVPRECEVMRLYGGEVQWEGTFEGFEEGERLQDGQRESS
jgi:hypothetical protein